jgi:hypothetical protein
MRKWRQSRSEHAEVLSGLERAIAAHPAGGRAVKRRSDPKAVTRVPREPGNNGSDAA